eukprot:g38444.t1
MKGLHSEDLLRELGCRGSGGNGSSQGPSVGNLVVALRQLVYLGRTLAASSIVEASGGPKQHQGGTQAACGKAAGQPRWRLGLRKTVQVGQDPWNYIRVKPRTFWKEAASILGHCIDGLL